MMNQLEFEAFFNSCGKDILRFCRMLTGSRDDGEELFQDTLLLLWQKRNNLKPEENIKSYALSVSTHLWQNQKRKRIRRSILAPVSSLDDASDNKPKIPSLNPEQKPLENSTIENEILDALRRFTAQLPPKYRIPLYLHYSANMTVTQISTILHIPEGTIKTRMRKAKRILKERLEAEHYDR